MSPSHGPAVLPEGWHAVTPRIAAAGARELVAFIKRVFEAEGEYRESAPSVLRIHDSLIMVGDAEARGAMPAFLYVYVPNVDSTFRQAVEAGARAVEEPLDTPYGDRRATVRDPWGNLWQIAAPVAPVGNPAGATDR